MNFNYKKYIEFFILIVTTIALTRCANIVAPDGGARDTNPPMPIKSEPVSNTTNFSEKYFRIWFDEFVRLKDAASQMTISPPLLEKPEITSRGKSIIVKLNDTLIKNTTYNFAFGNSIIDITEGNALNNFQYVFSTGNYIDSMSLKGKVLDAYLLNPIKDVSVFLYKNNIDSLPLSKIPDFIAKTNEAGEFSINNIPSGKFKIFALKDGNNNYIYDLPTEQIAFIDTLQNSYYIQKPNKKDSLQVDTIQLSKPEYKPLDLFLFTEYDSTQKLLKYNATGIGIIRFSFRLPAKNFSFIPLKPNWNDSSYIIEPNINGDTIQIWYSDIEADSLHAIISCKGIEKDTVTLRLITEKSLSSSFKRRGQAEPEKLNVSFSALTTKPIDLNKNFKIYFSRPIVLYNPNKIIFIDEIDTVKPKIFFSDSSKRILDIKYKWEEEKNYEIFIEPEAFTDIQGFYNDTLKVSFKSKTLNDYGSLNINIKNSNNQQIILYLLNQQNQIIKELVVTKSELLTLNFLPPSDYKLKAIFDVNKNKKWDTGNYSKKISPEKVLFYKQAIKVKGGWETEIEWEL